MSGPGVDLDRAIRGTIGARLIQSVHPLSAQPFARYFVSEIATRQPVGQLLTARVAPWLLNPCCCYVAAINDSVTTSVVSVIAPEKSCRSGPCPRADQRCTRFDQVSCTSEYVA